MLPSVVFSVYILSHFNEISNPDTKQSTPRGQFVHSKYDGSPHSNPGEQQSKVPFASTSMQTYSLRFTPLEPSSSRLASETTKPRALNAPKMELVNLSSNRLPFMASAFVTTRSTP
jgi:hypothetical protein